MVSRVKALGRVLLKALSSKEVLRGIGGAAEDYAAVAELILMLPMPGRATIARIVYRLVYNLVRALLTLSIIAPLLLPIILLALYYYLLFHGAVMA